MKQEDADKYLAKQPTDYELVLSGQDMTPFDSMDESGVIANTWIRPKSSKENIAPAKVQIQRDKEGKHVVAIAFSFPRKLAGGEPVISPEEKSVEFSCVAGKLSVRTNFEVRQMATKQGQDL